jgi:hypothetical protein
MAERIRIRVAFNGLILEQAAYFATTKEHKAAAVIPCQEFPYPFISQRIQGTC